MSYLGIGCWQHRRRPRHGHVEEVKVLPCCDYDVSVDFFALLRVCDCGFFLHCCECVIVDFFACEYVIDCCEYVIVGALQPM